MELKTELLICIGASAAANCVPCFDYYFKKAEAAGINMEEVRKSVELGNKIKRGAGIVMKNSIKETTGQDWDSESTTGRGQDHPCCT